MTKKKLSEKQLKNVTGGADNNGDTSVWGGDWRGSKDDAGKAGNVVGNNYNDSGIGGGNDSNVDAGIPR